MLSWACRVSSIRCSPNTRSDARKRTPR
jgi:hypothetical protein